MNANTSMKISRKALALALALVAALLMVVALLPGGPVSAFAADDDETSSSASAVETESDDEVVVVDEGEDEGEGEELVEQEDGDTTKSVTVDSSTDIDLLIEGSDDAVLTLVGYTVDDLELTTETGGIVTLGELTDNSTYASFSITGAKAGDDTINIVDKTDTSTVLASIEVTVKRVVTIDVTAKMSEATITATKTTTGKSISPTSGPTFSDGVTTCTYELAADEGLTYDVTAEGYDDSTDNTVKVGTGNVSKTLSLNTTKYTITYEMNGGTNSSANPSTYTIEDSAITIANPTTRTGYKFRGWTYTGQADGADPEKEPQIAAGSTGNMTFTAKWWTKGLASKVKVTNYSDTYDAEYHGLTIASTDDAVSITVLYSTDKGETYTEETFQKRDVGEFDVYFKVFDENNVYAPVTGTGTIKITSTNKVTDSTTGIIAKGDIFKKYTSDGKIVTMEVTDLSKSSSDSSHLSELKKKYYDSSEHALFKAYDVTLYLEDKDADTKTEITDDFGKVTLTFPVDTKYNNYSAVIYERHVVNGTTKEIPFKSLKVSSGSVDIKIDTLSDFVLLVNKKDSSSTTKSTSKSTAKTGDSTLPIIPIGIAIVAAAAAGVAIYQFRKQR